MKLILLINVKVPTIVRILTFICRITASSESFLKQEQSLFFSILVFRSSAVEISCSFWLSLKKIGLETWSADESLVSFIFMHTFWSMKT